MSSTLETTNVLPRQSHCEIKTLTQNNSFSASHVFKVHIYPFLSIIYTLQIHQCGNIIRIYTQEYTYEGKSTNMGNVKRREKVV